MWCSTCSTFTGSTSTRGPSRASSARHRARPSRRFENTSSMSTTSSSRSLHASTAGWARLPMRNAGWARLPFKDHMVKAGELMRCPVDGCARRRKFDIVDELMAHIAQAHPADAKTDNSDTIRLSAHKIPSLMNATYECNSVDLANW